MGGPEGRARRLGRQRVHTYARANDDQQMPEVVRSFYCQLCANASLRGCVNPASWIPLAVAVVPRNLLATNMHSTVHSMPANRFVLPAAPLADPHYGIPGFLVLFPFWGFTSLKSSVLFVRNSWSSNFPEIICGSQPSLSIASSSLDPSRPSTPWTPFELLRKREKSSPLPIR